MEWSYKPKDIGLLYVTEDRTDQHTTEFLLKSLDRISIKLDLLIDHDIKNHNEIETIRNDLNKEISWLKNELQTKVKKLESDLEDKVSTINKMIEPSQDFISGISTVKRFSKFIIYCIITIGAIGSSIALLRDRFLP